MLDQTPETCRHIWNLASADRRIAWKQEGKSRSYEDQSRLLTEEKQKYPELYSVYAQVLQDVLRRLKKAFDNFFRRCREGERKKGYPRFKGKGQYKSFTYPQLGFKLEGSRLTLFESLQHHPGPVACALLISFCINVPWRYPGPDGSSGSSQFNPCQR